MIRKTNIATALCFSMCLFCMFDMNAQTAEEKLTLPDFELKLHDSTSVNLSELKGKVVLLDFWYRGCAPCVLAIPELMELQEEFKNDLVIIGIDGFDIQEDVIDHFNYKKANYRSTYKTTANIPKALGIKITGYPTILLYDKEGKLIQMETGYSKSGMRSIRTAIKKAIK